MRYVFSMAYNAAINVRLDPADRERLEKLANGFGVKSSVLIRQAVEDYLLKLESEKRIVINMRKEVRVIGTANLNEKPSKYGKK